MSKLSADGSRVGQLLRQGGIRSNASKLGDRGFNSLLHSPTIEHPRITRKELKSMTYCSAGCGWRLPLKAVESMAHDDQDPDFTLREKMFQILACFQETDLDYGDPEPTHNCTASFMGERLAN